ncbi:MAG: hypothetical protein ACKO6N_04710 [Myxococcota bacterium]
MPLQTPRPPELPTGGDTPPRITLLPGGKTAAPLSSVAAPERITTTPPEERRRHLALVVPDEQAQFEAEVAAALKEISPEPNPASPEARRMGRRILIGTIIVESVLIMGFGWYLKRWEGALFGLLALLLFGFARAFLILVAGILREKDRIEAEALVHARRKAKKNPPEAPRQAGPSRRSS